MNKPIIKGDFVLVNTPGAMQVGLVQEVEGELAYVWWHLGDKIGGPARTLEQRLLVSELRIVGNTDHIPASMILLREDSFGNKLFCVRRHRTKQW